LPPKAEACFVAALEDVSLIRLAHAPKRMPQTMATRRFLKTTLGNCLFYGFLDGVDVHMMAPF
jgi:hypothetical protein